MALMAAGLVMLVPFYWVLKTSVSGENIYAYPPSIMPRNVNLFYYVDVWYAIPFARYFLNSVAVSLIAVAGNVVFNAMAGYALSHGFRGKNVVLLRVKAFALGGAIIGVAGAFHAYYLTYIDPSQFSATITAYVFMAVIAGGRGSNRGLLLGAATIMVFIEGTRFLKDLFNVLDATQLAAIRLMLIGLGLILFLIYRPQGFLPEYRLKTTSLVRERPSASQSAS